MTLWEFTKERWTLKKKEIKGLGIDPNKDSNNVTWGELEQLAGACNVTVGEFIEY
ncbi:hypothetical protein [uncultured Tenacibaculum sp.]|uniref:hypothetical protein n=1 Tax=uncultured Tenacibaculum sp. TaxID=174713 RepID=UPI002629ABDD|nr:hypothetical protein [uncultured Tenacibaculum sp.]